MDGYRIYRVSAYALSGVGGGVDEKAETKKAPINGSL